MPDKADLVIRSATIVDGGGGPAMRGDLAVAEGRIQAIGALGDVTGEREIDGTGQVLCPGFIDVHTHDDRELLSAPAMTPKVSQGVTTVVAGNCGVSLAPLVTDERPVPPLDLLGVEWFRFAEFGRYLEAVDAARPVTNAVFLVGHQTLRYGAMGRDLDCAASAGETAAMAAQVEAAMRAGAIGLSTGLFYPPAQAAPTEEIVALAKVAGAAGGLYATHLRDEGDALEESVAEALTIGREGALPVVFSHHKATGRKNFGKVRRSLAQIDAAAAGQKVALDVYPYAAGSTVLLPQRIDMAEKVMITWSEAMPDAGGRYLHDLAAEHGLSDQEMAVRLQPAGAIYFMMNEADVQTVLRHPMAMIGSDGIPTDPRPHPRLWGTFPRVLGHYVRELNLMPLEEAVRRMTGLPAETFGLRDRGRLVPGAWADLVLFDPATVIDRASFDNPIQTSAGIGMVAVNGEVVWADGAATDARPGRALRRAA
ncbi:amidohydrolase family protein [Marinibaculum pumilum]|uniref:Amidohydrolase family protein n=1 Tax=Marinibaculum pumilum TaxID=1766165 RepID=A0ABV7L2L7_9PROT